MAEEISDEEFNSSFKNVKYDKHDWDKWTNGTAYRVTQGEDFNCTVAGFTTGLYNRANRNGMKVRVKKVGTDKVEFQFRKA